MLHSLSVNWKINDGPSVTGLLMYALLDKKRSAKKKKKKENEDGAWLNKPSVCGLLLQTSLKQTDC